MTISKRKRNALAQKRYKQRHPARVRAARRAYYRRKRKYFTRLMRARRKKNPVLFRRYARTANDKLRQEVFTHYCHGRPRCMCPGCDIQELAFLTLQHLRGGGTQQRRTLGPAGTGTNFYYWVRKVGYPKYLTVFCANCNIAASRFGGCPHRRKQA